MRRPQSYSSISLYKKCPKLWHHQYVLGNKKPAGKAADRGVELHARLEEFFLGSPYPSAVKALAPWQRYMENLTVYKPIPEREYAVKADWTPCEFNDPEAYARGKGDLVYADSSCNIFDWKSGKVYPDHEHQGKMYMALEEEYPTYTTHFVYLDIPLHVMSRTYTKSDRLIEQAKLINTIEIINADETYDPTPSVDSCAWCDLSWRRGGSCRSAP